MQTQYIHNIHILRKTDRPGRRPTSHSGLGVVTSLLLAPLLLAPLGCDRADAPHNLSTASAQMPDPTTAGGAEPASPAPRQSVETWDAVYMGGAKIGSNRTLYETIAQGGQTWTKVSNWTQLEIVRFGQRSTLSTHVESWEKETGEVHSFKTETRAGPSPILVEGRCRGEKLDLVISTQGKQLKSTIPWEPSQGGFFAVEQSLKRQPMKPGEKREVTLLMPGLTGIERVTSSLTAEVMEPVTLLDRTEQLLKIKQSSKVGGMTIDSVGWTDAQGEILKTTIPSLDQTMIRTTKEIAQADGTGKYDLGWDSIVKITPPLPHPHQLTKAVYEVSLSDKDPAGVFVSGISQTVESVDEHTARITILAVTPDSPTTSVPEASPGPGDTQPNSLIQADDPQIKDLAEKVAGQQAGTWNKCVAFEKWVHAAIRTKNFGQGFATAADVARSLEGDCTEHAVLLAALCRAQSIPARVAIGLVYSPRDQGFAFHMWNEAWVDGRWIPLDATLGQGGIGAAHLKLACSNLQGQGAETAVLSVVQVINQLKIRVLEYEPR